MIRRVEEEPASGFPSMGLSPVMLKALKHARYLTPTPIQAAFIPQALDGLDVIGQAKTGTGKTAAFGIPLIEMLEGRMRGPQGIILAPTRELTQQIVGELQKLTMGSEVSVCGIFGGEPIERQLRALSRGVDLIVGTPGRVLDHIERRTLYLGDIVHVVLDEADRMLDIGFRPDIERILRKLPSPRQTMLLSATINADVRRLAHRYMFEPIEVNLSQDEPSLDTIQQYYVPVTTDRKFDLLVLLLKRDRPRQCIVFTRTKRGADRLAERLRRVVTGVSAIHGDLAQNIRDRVMRGFRSGEISVLVATDVVGRGIDVEGISHVINYDMPDDTENYVHRIGRTGRMGKDGIAYLFVCPDQGEPLTAIESMINRVIPPLQIEGFTATRPRVEPAARELFNNTAETRSRALAMR
ncbi:MAG TPA: DEAD/DEAH box helicase [Isosphaeraceae bacterium]|nr:DEAD/DEAH box helicase [Isosphaeraceae bacterium]